MEVEFDTSTQYCSTSDVARFFEQYDDFTANTNPTATEVESLIDEWTEYIDRETGHAWRNNRVIDEYHDLSGPYYYWSGRPIKLMKRQIRTPLDSGEGDKLEIWRGNEWEDWVSDSAHSEGRENDYWVNESTGTLYIYRRLVYNINLQIRVSYRYGKDSVDKQIRMACAKLTAADLAHSDQYSMNIPGTDGGVDAATAAERWEEQAERVIQNRKEVRWAEPF